MELSRKPQQEANDLLIRLCNLSHSYGDYRVFANISADFHKHKIYLITGDNGAGKSTFLKLLAGLLEAELGQIVHRLNGQNIAPENLYNYVSACASWISLPGNLRVEEFFRLLPRFKPFINNYRAEDLLTKANLIGLRNKNIKHLSDGQYQRVALFYALFVQSVFTILDEPLRALDQDSANLYKDALLEVSKCKTLFITSHRAEFYTDIPDINYFHLQPFSHNVLSSN